jgi:hypothetical protein
MKLVRLALLLTSTAACGGGPTVRTPEVRSSAQGTVACLGEAEMRLSYDIGCSAPDDCRVVWAPVDCCGTSRAMGVRRADESNLKRALQACPQRATCECLAQPTLLDSGERCFEPNDIMLACERGRCVTRLFPTAQVAPVKAGFNSWPERRAALRAAHERLSPTSGEEGPKSEALSYAWCRGQVNYPETAPLQSCALDELGQGSVLLLTLVTECGGDSCTTEGYVMNAALPEFVRVPHDVGAGVEASPEGDALFVSSITDAAMPAPEGESPRDPLGGEEPVILTRIAVPSLESAPFAPCFSPTVSPQGRWVLCRDRAANVLKVPLSGGQPSLVWSSGLRAEDVYHVWYAYIWPQQVSFVSTNRFKVTVVRASGELFESEIDWRE